MLRMEFYRVPNCMKLWMEGQFIGEFAEHVRVLIGDYKLPSVLIVDLSEVNYVDEVGERVLLWFKEIGGTFAADSAYSHDVCERLELPIEGGPPDQQNQSHGTPGRAQGCLPRLRSPIPLRGEMHS